MLGFLGRKLTYSDSAIGYTPVIKHSNGKSPVSIGNTSSKGSFSVAMLDYQRVTFKLLGMTFLVGRWC